MSVEQPISAREAVNAYAASQISGAAPGQLVILMYDFVIGCCRRGDRVNAKNGLVELMGSLNLDYVDVAGPLYRLYEYCLDRVRDGNFDEALHILTDVRQAWEETTMRAEARTPTCGLETRGT